MFEAIQQKLNRIQFTASQQQDYLEDLNALVEDGVPANQAIQTIESISKGIAKTVAHDMAEGIAHGKGISEGMRGWFAGPIIEIVHAGEQGGRLSDALKSAIQFLAEQSNAVTALINSLVYPSVIMAMSLGLTVFIKNSVLETFTLIKPLAEWPLVGRSLYHFGGAIQSFWWLYFTIAALIVVVLAQTMKLLTGPPRYAFDKIPGMALYRDTVGARFMQTLGLLIINGITLNKALSIMQRDAQPFLSWHLMNMELLLSRGQENIADVLDTKLIREDDFIRLKVIAKGRGFEQALVKLGRRSAKRNYDAITRAGNIIGVGLMVLAAGLAASLIFGIYMVATTFS